MYVHVPCYPVTHTHTWGFVKKKERGESSCIRHLKPELEKPIKNRKEFHHVVCVGE